MKYRREIDGLRAVAILPVILFHAGFSAFQGGFIGVDVFFVISGYLINTILIDENRSASFSILRFYERRARRILPALFVMLAFCFVMGFAVMLPSELKELSAAMGSVTLFLSNFYFMSQVGYFATDAEVQPLLHTWSLAVEEQFYLLLPLLLWFCRKLPERRVVGILWVLAVLSLILAEFGWRMDADRNFFFSGTRFWELLAGSLLAYHLSNRPVRPSQIGAALGLGLILFGVVWLSPAQHFPGLLTLIPVLGTVLVILYADLSTWTGRLLGLRPLVATGLISYSAYLWHQPIFAFARLSSLSDPSPLLMSGLAVLTLGAAVLSWRFVEQPFQRGQGRLLPGRAALFWASGIVSAVFFAFGFAGYKTGGYDAIWRALYPAKVEMLDLVVAARAPEAVPERDCVFATRVFDAELSDKLRACVALHGPGALVIGDSHAIDLFATLARTSAAPFVLGVTSGGCRAHDVVDGCFYDDIQTLVSSNPVLFDIVIYEQAGIYLFTSAAYPDGNRRMIAGLGLSEPVPDYAANLPRIDMVAAYLQGLADHVPVVWFGPRPEPHIPLESILRTGCDVVPLRPGLTERFAALDKVILSHLPAQVRFLSQSAVYDIELPRDFGGCDGLFWRDGDHLSVLGQRELGGRADVVQAARALVWGRSKTP